MEVAIVADTHIPDREQSIPDAFEDRISTADHVIHAGDFTTTEVLADVRDLATELTAVHGNMDGGAVDLPAVASVDVEAVTFVVTHGTARSRAAWFDAVATAAREHASDSCVGVGGHTHQVEDEEHDGIRVLNPGSVTGAAPASTATMLTATVDDDEVDVTVHEA